VSGYTIDKILRKEMLKGFLKTKKSLQIFLIIACLVISLLTINHPKAGNVPYVYYALYRLI